MTDSYRPNPDELLKAINKQETKSQGGKLRIFFGMSAGVGKTYAMLQAAQQRIQEGVDIAIGVAETHGRQETEALLKGIPQIPKQKIDYKGTVLEELDLDAVLKRKPKIVVVDELAHTNVPGARHPKRYQDVLEILRAGIDVYTAMNVQHLESRKESVESFTGITIQETVPDSVMDRANQIELIDIAPHELLKRLKEGKVYLGDRAQVAAQNFFKEGTLTALREVALRFTAERVDQQLRDMVDSKQLESGVKASERLMVAVSHSPYSQSLIRATRRLAYNLEAAWVAVNIDTGLPLNNEDQAQLAKNLTLARELGAEVVSTTDTSVPAALKRIAKQKGVTQIVVGRPVRRWVRDYLEGGSLLDRLVRESGDVDVHVIRYEAPNRKTPSILSQIKPHSSFSQYWTVSWWVAGAILLGELINPWVGYRAVGFLFLAVVLAVSLFVGIGPIIFTAILSAIAWNYFFIPPLYTFVITSPEDFMMCVAYLIVAATMGVFAARIRRHESILREREERANFLYEITREIAASHHRSEFLENILGRMNLLFNGECNVFLRDQFGKLNSKGESRYHFEMGEKEMAVAQWAFDNQKRAGWSTDTLPLAKTLYIPLRGPREVLGVFAFRPKSTRRLSTEQENILYSSVRQISLAIEQEILEDRSKEAEKLRESERLHQTLLNSISHELRTPLTAIMGSASALADEKNASNPEKRFALIQNLTESGDRLNRVVANLLDMTRLSSGVMTLHKDWYSARELVVTSLSKTKHYVGNHIVKVNIQDDLPPINVDFTLMEHVVFNLVLNAVTYSPENTEVIVSAFIEDDDFFITVEDQGPGIPQDQQNRIFDKFHRLPGTAAGGLGLGLSICRSIVELHHGAITAENRPEGGAKFMIILPLEKSPPTSPDEVRQ